MVEQVDGEVLISSLNIAESRRGVREQAPGRKRDELEARFAGLEALSALFAGRVVTLDEKVVWRRLMADGKAEGRSGRSARPVESISIRKVTMFGESATCSGLSKWTARRRWN